MEKSADVIVPTGNEVQKNCIGLTDGEGLNAILLEIMIGAVIFINWVTDSQENL